ncbi:hypothetical protein ALON55S_04876 [Alishewanella longhuensis]
MLKPLIKNASLLQAAGEPYGAISFEAPHLCKDGSVVWGEVQWKGLRDEQGKSSGFHRITRKNVLKPIT